MDAKARKKVRAVYMLDPDVKRAIRLDAADKERDMSDVVNDVMRKVLRVDSKPTKQTA